MASVTASAENAITTTAAADNALTVSASAVNDLSVTASLLASEQAGLSASQTIGVTVDALLTAAVSVAASQTVAASIASNLTAAPALAASQTITTSEASNLSAAVSLSASQTIGVSVASDLTSPNDLTASQTIAVTTAADLTASVALFASQTVGVTVSSVLAAPVTMSASQTIAVTIDANLSATVSLAASQSIGTTESSNLSAAVSLAASDLVAVSIDANLTAAVDLSASQTIAATIGANLSASPALAASQTIAATVDADLTASVALSASQAIGVTVDSAASAIVSLAASQTIGVTIASAVELVPVAMTSGQWTVTTGDVSGELDFSIVTAPSSDATITGYRYTTDGGTTTAVLPGGTATGTTRAVTTLSAGGAISSGQVFTSQVAVYADSAVGLSLISDLKTVTAGAGASYDPAANADFYFEVGRSGQEFWEELTGQTTATTNGNVVGEIENIGTGSANAFAHGSGTRGTLNTTSGLLELTNATDSYQYNPGSVPSGCTIAWVGALDETADGFPDRLFSIAIPGDADVDGNGVGNVEHTFTAGQFQFVSGYSTVGTAFTPSSGFGENPLIMTHDFGASGTMAIYSDNTLLESATRTSAISGTVTDLDIGILSANTASGGYAPVELKAFAYFDTVLSASDREDLNTYLAAL